MRSITQSITDSPLHALGLALLAVVATLWSPAAASGQTTRDVEPYFVAIVDENSLLRSGDLRSYYPIATLRPNTILRVTGEGERWLRVEYPKGIHALVRADRATLNEASGMGTVSRTGALKALSDTRYGIDGSFRDVQGPATPATTQLKHHRTETSSRGIVFYVVDAPSGAAGFVETSQTRRATPSEIRAYLATLEESQGGGQTPQPAEPLTAPETRPDTQPRSTDLTPPPAELSGDSPTLMEPMTIEPSDPIISRPIMQPMTEAANETQQATPRDTITPVPSVPAETGSTEPEASEPERPDSLGPMPSLQALSTAFDAVRKQGTLEAEVDELVAAFERVLANTPDIEDNASTRTWLQQRLSLLDIRKRLQESLQEVAAAKARLEAGNEQSSEAMARLEASRIYDFVGRLEKSAVYNGDRLPLMYRLVSVGEGIPRTLGYIEPAEGLELARKLGVLVGISGGATRRADLRLSTIGASSGVVLRSVETDNTQFATEPDR